MNIKNLNLTYLLGIIPIIYSNSPTQYPTVLATIPCLNCNTLDPTGAPTYTTYEALGVSVNSQGLRVLFVLFTLVIAAILVTYIGYVRSMYNKYGEVQVKRKKADALMGSSTHSEVQLMETSLDKS